MGDISYSISALVQYSYSQALLNFFQLLLLLTLRWFLSNCAPVGPIPFKLYLRPCSILFPLLTPLFPPPLRVSLMFKILLSPYLHLSAIPTLLNSPPSEHSIPFPLFWSSRIPFVTSFKTHNVSSPLATCAQVQLRLRKRWGSPICWLRLGCLVTLLCQPHQYNSIKDQVGVVTTS